METIGVYDAKNKLSRLLDRILKGEEFTITRRGEAVARLLPIAEVLDRQQARAAALRIVKRSQSVRRSGVDAKTLRTAREAGRL
jgi:prevent-host-death family protein